MIYFARAVITAKENQETTLYIILDEPDSEYDLPVLTKEQIAEHSGYKAFVSKYRPKSTVTIDYTVYKVDRDIDAATPDETFEKLIGDRTAERLSGGELLIEHDEKPNKKTGKLQRKKKTPLLLLFLIVIGGMVLVGGSLALGMKIGKKRAAVVPVAEPVVNAAEDGLIIPKQEDIRTDAEQITVTIDRSYSAVPTDDLQLKGEVSNGKANIKLPEFDRSDFFTHVAGYTWGFSSDPNGKRIEYYGGESYDFTADTKLYRVLVKYGGGYLIENLTAPLFGNVSGALIKNVNIRNSRIESPEYRDYGFIVCNAYNYHYKAENEAVYVTGETKIQHCTVSHSSINVQYPKTEEQTTTAAVVTAPPVMKPTKLAEHCIGAISGNGGEISDCYVTDFGIYCKTDSYYLYCGGIVGEAATDSTSALIANCYANELSLHTGTYDSKEQQQPTKEGVPERP